MRASRFATLLVGVSLATLALPATGDAVQSPQNQVVSAVPAAWTPAINNGQVNAFAQVGSTMVVGGSFTSVTKGSTLTRNYIVAFDATNGTVSTTFAPNLNGEVDALVPGPNNTVYVGGAFTQMNGAAVPRVLRLNVSDGSQTAGFRAGAMNGVVNTMALSGNRLYVGGNFTTVGGVAHGGITSLNATTGAVDPFVNLQVAGHHNNTGSGAQGPVGVRALDVTPDGTRLIAIGNFRTVNGLNRDQIVLVDLDGASAAVDPNWATNAFDPMCFNWAFDTYVRGVQFSPDGSYFVVAATGGQNAGTLCDAISKWATNATGSNVQPIWSDLTGGDTVWSVAVTGTAIYIGGHPRWINNPEASDRAGQGAIPRPGLMALDPVNGLPLAWDPGRNPRGAGAEALLATPDGLWVGSDTDWIGNYQYKRPKMAFFPLAGGYTPVAPNTGSLPGQVYLAGLPAGGGQNVLYRVDSGGPAIASQDAGPNWGADTSGSPSPYLASADTFANNNTADYSPIQNVNSSVPAGTPSGIFDHERWSSTDFPNLEYDFPVPAGTHVQVRLYMANRYSGTSQPGQRVFNVYVEGTKVLSNYDIVADVGDQTGEMKSFNATVNGDGKVTIQFTHNVENPLINGIEIINLDAPQGPPGNPDGVMHRSFDGATAGADQTDDNGGISWSQARGAVMVGNTLYYGWNDGMFYKRSYDGGTFGSATLVDPYHDPYWDGVDNGSGSTYDGAFPSFYGNEIKNVTGMFFTDGKLFYTLSGQSSLYYRYFTPDSGAIGEIEFTASGGMNWSDTDGMFYANNTLYFGSASTGNLSKVSFVNDLPSGSAQVVSGPSIDGKSWQNKAMFLYAGPQNQPPTAAFTSFCQQLSCNFDGSSSNDPDGTIASYAWDFGDGGTGTGVSPNHVYGADGTYTVKLTVTDNRGAQGVVTHDVTVKNQSVQPVTFGGANHSSANVKTNSVNVPSGTAAGDTLLLFESTTSGTSQTGPSGVSGWQQLSQQVNGAMTTTVWWKTADAGDAGSAVSIGFSAATQSNLVIADYKSTNGAAPVFAASGDTSTATHVTPNLSLSGGQLALSFWTDKSSTTTSWTVPGSVTQRDLSLGNGGGRYTSVLADSANPVGPGNYGGLTATTDAPSGKAVMFTIALSPQS